MRPLALCAVFAALVVHSTAARPQNVIQQQSVNLSGLKSVSRPVDKSYPVTGPARVFVANKYGAVRIVPWADRIVRVRAQIRAGADTADQAERFAQSVDVDGAHVGDRIEVRTRYPRLDPQQRIGGYGTDLEISVPADASIEIQNEWGDVYVTGLDGSVAINALYGEVQISGLRGPVRVQAKGAPGQFRLSARNLMAGGTFTLRSIDAEFENVRGQLRIDNYLGAVVLRPGAAPLELDVTCDNGPIDLYLGAGSLPDLVATADSGNVDSELVLAGETWGGTTTLRHHDPEAAQHINLYASFSEIRIHQEALAAATEPLVAPEGSPITDTLEGDYTLVPGTALRLNLMAGDVTIEGHDVPRVQVRAARFIRVADVDLARMALEGLAMRADFGTDYLGLTTAVQEDMKALGCTDYRMDVRILVPRGVPVILRAQGRETEISNVFSDLAIEQETGSVRLRNIQGNVKIAIADGSIDTNATAGTLDLSAGGDITVRRSFGPINARCEGGKTLIDSPNSGVIAHTKGGDVRVIAVDGVKGDYDISTENGNISIAVPDTEDVAFWLDVYEGTYRSSVPLTGTSQNDNHTFQGRLNAGTRRILLKAHNGTIMID